MAVKLNAAGRANANALIKGGKIDKTSAWSMSAADENAILGKPPDWAKYSKWHLGIDSAAKPDTKAHYKYPFGKNSKIYRKAITAIRQRAAQQGHTDIFKAAGTLLAAIDKKGKKAVPDDEIMGRSELFYRHVELDSRAVDEDSREMEFSFSSEEPVVRWFGKEVLLHGKKNADLSRLQRVGSLLFSHNPYDIKNILGPVKKVWITDGRLGRTRVGFDDDETSNLALAKVRSGSLRGVSFGYMINTAQRIEEGEEWTDPDSKQIFKGPAIVATRWTPYEITLTPIPADATVGIGRDATRSLDGIHIVSTQRKETTIMNREEIEEMIRDAIAGLSAPSIDDITRSVVQALAEQNRPKYGCTIEQFQEIFGRAAAVSPAAQTEMASMLTQGKTAAEMQTRLLELATTNPDARDAGGGDGGEGTGMDSRKQADHQAQVRSFKQISDDDFFAGLSNPAAFAIN